MLIGDTGIDSSAVILFSSTFPLTIFPLSIILMLQAADSSLLKSSAMTAYWLTSPNSHLSDSFSTKTPDERFKVIELQEWSWSVVLTCTFPDGVVWRWVRPPPGMKGRVPFGVDLSCYSWEVPLPHDGSVLLAFCSWHPLLKLTAEKSKHSCLGWARQRLQKCYFK